MPFLARNLNLSSDDLLHSGHNGADWRPPLNPADTYSPSEAMSNVLFGGKSVALHGVVGMRCGSPECRTSRPMLWRSRRRPIFEDAWGCSRKCTLAIVQAAIRRKGEEISTSVAMEHRHRVPLGLVLLEQGWITHAQLQNALGTQRLQGGRIGECLLLEGIEGTRITRGLGIQWGCPVLTTAGFDSQKMALVMPQVFIERFGAVPIRTAGSRMLYVGFESSLDASLTFSLEQMTGLKVEDGILQAEEWGLARAQLGKAESVSAKSVTGVDIDSLGSQIALILERERPVYSRLVKIHHSFWLRLWLEEGALSGAGMLPRSSEDVRDYVLHVL